MNGHTEDKPKDCRYCYFWKQTEGCTYRGKTDCYYVSAQKLVYERAAALYGPLERA